MKVTIREGVLFVAVCVLAGLAISYSINNHEANRKLAMAEAQIAADGKIISTAKAAQTQAEAAIQVLKEQAAADKEQLQSDAFTANLNAEKLRIKMAKLQSAQPSELIGDAQAVLGPGETIKFNGTAYIIGADTFRLIVVRLTDWSDFTLVREPAYKKTILDWAALSSNQDKQLEQKDVVIKQLSIQLGSTQDIVAQLHKEIGIYKKRTFWSEVKWGGIGLAAGWLTGHFTK